MKLECLFNVTVFDTYKICDATWLVKAEKHIKQLIYERGYFENKNN